MRVIDSDSGPRRSANNGCSGSGVGCQTVKSEGPAEAIGTWTGPGGSFATNKVLPGIVGRCGGSCGDGCVFEFAASCLESYAPARDRTLEGLHG